MSPTLLFAHSPLVGPSTWAGTAEVLRDRGFGCGVPDLRKALDSGPPYYPKLAAVAAEAIDEGPFVLIGHSGAGPLLPAVAGVVGEVHAAVFVDALLPHPGRSWFDTAPEPLRDQLRELAADGVLPPWSEWFPPGAIDELIPDSALRREFLAELPRVPIAYFDEPAPAVRVSIPCALLRLSGAYDHAAHEAERLGWWVAHRDWDHLRMLTAPDAVADLISQAISAVT